VQQPAGVDGVEPGSDAFDQPHGSLDREPPLELQDLGEVTTLDVFHREPEPSVVLAAVVHADDRLVLHLTREVGFRAEALPVDLVTREALGHQLERVGTRQPRMASQVDLSHAALADAPLDPVSREQGSGRQHGYVLSGRPPRACIRRLCTAPTRPAGEANARGE
jgi:hypothetical protein